MKSENEMYRIPEKGKIAGVCAGVAEYFGWELWLVRIVTVTGTLLSGNLFVIGYFLAWFIMDKKPQGKGDVHLRTSRARRVKKGKGWHAEPEENERVEIKEKVWQAGEPPRRAFKDIKHKFAKVETRLRNVEKYVTSSEYQLNKEINSL